MTVFFLNIITVLLLTEYTPRLTAEIKAMFCDGLATLVGINVLVLATFEKDDLIRSSF